MKLNITLCKTPINTTDTLYFANVEAQKDYFNSITDKIEYTNASFNGARNFRIQENYLAAINSKYNYMYYEYDGRVWYTFIDKYKYVNDNVTELEVTLDFLQTFMFDITLKTSRVASYTWKEEHFEQNYKVPYSNKFPASVPDWQEVYNLGYEPLVRGKLTYVLMNMVITCNVDLLTAEPFNDVSLYRGLNGGLDPIAKNLLMPSNYPAKLPYFSIIIPVSAIMDNSTNEDYGLANYVRPTNMGNFKYTNIGGVKEFMERISAYIVDVSMVPNKIYEYTSYDGNNVGVDEDEFIFGYVQTSSGNQVNFISPALQRVDTSGATTPMTMYAEGIFAKYIDLNIDLDDSLINSTYASIKISNGTDESFIELDEYLYKSDKTAKEGVITLKYQASQLYPFSYTLNLAYYSSGLNRTFKISRIDAISMPFSVDKWQQFYASNSASINDGLRTKHGYEREIAKANLANKTAQGAVQTLAGIGTIAGAATSAIFNPMQAINMGMNGLNQAIQGAGSIADAVVQYENTLTNQEKERALLEISWKDIQNAPSDIMSFGLIHGLNQLNQYLGSVIYIGIASNIEAIKKYHKMYGYETHEVISPADLKRAHNIFDYIRFEDANFITNLAHNTHNIIKSILESGIRFWYDINTFMNFDIENTEYEG